MKRETESIKKLATTLIDSKHGYEEALKDDGGSDLAPIFREMIALREQDLADLGRVLSSMGENPDEKESFMTFVQRTVIDVRSALTGLGEKTLPSFIRGEESVLSRYNDAIKDCGDDAETVRILSLQRQLLQDKISEMKGMKAG
jgi:uncharacterized protein (TIGR02284 family)